MPVAYRSDIGKKRASNQDYAGCFKNKESLVLAIVCDGMGGHQAGDVASEMAVSHLGNSWKESEVGGIEAVSEWLIEKIEKENQRIVEKSRKYTDLEGMGTTLVAAAVVGNQAVLAHIGDSRGYHFTNNQLHQITEDHSLVNELLKFGQISPEEALNHPRKNVLTRSLGVNEGINVDVTSFPLQSTDLILLCSDGLTNMVSDEEIAKILKEPITKENKIDLLISLANERGGSDNITVMLVDVHPREEGE